MFYFTNKFRRDLNENVSKSFFKLKFTYFIKVQRSMGTREGIMTKLSLRVGNEIKRLEIHLKVTRPVLEHS